MNHQLNSDFKEHAISRYNYKDDNAVHNSSYYTYLNKRRKRSFELLFIFLNKLILHIECAHSPYIYEAFLYHSSGLFANNIYLFCEIGLEAAFDSTSDDNDDNESNKYERHGPIKDEHNDASTNSCRYTP